MKMPIRAVVFPALIALCQMAQAQSLSLVSGWNLAGNNSSAAIDPIAAFGNVEAKVGGVSDQILTAWTWDQANSSWKFFAPSMTPVQLKTYADAKSYSVLGSIVSGDGYWVNAKASLTLALPGAAGGTPATRSLLAGWNLLGNNSPAALDPVKVFGSGITTSQVVTVWKWDRLNSSWMFFAPSMNSTDLTSYAAGKGYGVLASILPGDGFWVNASTAASFALPPTLSGVAATGGALANARVELKDAAGKTLTTTTDAEGGYQVSAEGLSAPVVVRVSGISGDSHVSLTSMLDTLPTGNSATVNVTPLTNAIAAVLSGADSAKLDPSTAADKTAIQNNLAKAKTYVASALANTLRAAGVSGSFDPVSTPMAANGKGVDRILDNLNVTVAPDGSASIVNLNSGIAANTVDDTAQKDAAFAPPPVAGSALTISKSTDLSATPASIDASDATLPDPDAVKSLLASLKTALNACTASSASQSGTITVSTGVADFSKVGAACADFFKDVSPNYLHNGNDAAKDFAGLFSSTLYQTVFDQPYIDRFVTPTRAIIQAPYLRTDGVRKKFATLVTNVNGSWQLLGNQRDFDASVQPVVEKRRDLNTKTGSNAVNLMSAYTVGLNIKVNLSAGDGNLNPFAQKIMWVLVTGKGLGNGTFGRGALLKNQSNCPYFTFVSNNADNTAKTNNAISPNSGGNCAAYMRLAGIGLDSKTPVAWPNNGTNNKPSYGDTMATEANLATSAALDAYTMQIHYCMSGGPFNAGAAVCPVGSVEKDVFIVERLATPLPTLAQAAAMSYPVPDASLVAAITPNGANAYAGGPSIPVSWNPAQSSAPPVDGLNIQIADVPGNNNCNVVDVSPGVPFSASLNADGSAKDIATVNPNSPQTSQPFPSASSILQCVASGSNPIKRTNMIKLSSHRKDGLQIQSVIEYSNN